MSRFADERKPDGRGKNSLGGAGMVSLSRFDKRTAINKLGVVYGVFLARWSWDDVSREVAKALRVECPEDLATRTMMVHGFAVSKRGALPPEEDRVAALAARFPFKPLQVSAEMERAMQRVREYREVGTHKNETSDTGES